MSAFVEMNDSDIERIKQAITAATKPVWSEHGPAATKVISAVRSALKSANKKKIKTANKKGDKGKESVSIDDAPPLVQRCIDVMSGHDADESECIVATDSLHMKPGSSKFSMTRAPRAFVLGMDKLKAIKSQMKWLSSQIAKDKMSTAITAFKPPITKGIVKLLKEHMPKRLSDNVVLPSDQAALFEDIFLPQAFVHSFIHSSFHSFIHPFIHSFIPMPMSMSMSIDVYTHTAFVQTDTHMALNMTPYGLPEIRYLIEGSYNVIGIPLNVAHPAAGSLQDKINMALTPEGAARFCTEAKKAHGLQHIQVHVVMPCKCNVM